MTNFPKIDHFPPKSLFLPENELLRSSFSRRGLADGKNTYLSQASENQALIFTGVNEIIYPKSPPPP